MKKITLLFFVTLLFGLTSCLERGLDDLPEYTGKDITGVQRVEYRFISTTVSGASGQNVVKFVTLTRSATIDATNKYVGIKVTVPAANASSFPTTERDKCALTNIDVIVSLSTAARIAPLNGAPTLGVPGDWSKPNKYLVTAANGDTQEWTIEVTSFTK